MNKHRFEIEVTVSDWAKVAAMMDQEDVPSAIEDWELRDIAFAEGEHAVETTVVDYTEEVPA